LEIFIYQPSIAVEDRKLQCLGGTLFDTAAKIAQCMNDLNAELQGYPQQRGTKFFDNKVIELRLMTL
jgi:hypothetical protein